MQDCLLPLPPPPLPLSVCSLRLRLTETDCCACLSPRSQVSHTSEEVLALKRFIQRCAQDQERLKELIAQNKERDEFMFKHRCGAGVG